MEIKNALDWSKLSIQLDAQLRALGHNPDLRKMLKNIDDMVTELSKMEVEARRIHSITFTQPILNKINKAIDHLDKLLLMAKLMA
jgi:hypothetical protein